jgi:hypothetical protein
VNRHGRRLIRMIADGLEKALPQTPPKDAEATGLS